MRYEKFILPNYKTVMPAANGEKEGLYVINHNISELEQCENRNQNKVMEAL